MLDTLRPRQLFPIVTYEVNIQKNTLCTAKHIMYTGTMCIVHTGKSTGMSSFIIFIRAIVHFVY